MRSVEKDILDSVGHEATHHPTEIHRKEDGKVMEKDMAREHRRVASPKEEKVETKGKEKVKERKERKGNVSTKSQNLQKSSGQVDLGNNGQINLGMLKQTLRVGGKMTGTQQIRILKHQQPVRNFNMLLSVNCDFRILVLPNTVNVFRLTHWTLRSEPLHLALIPLHAKLLFLPISQPHVDI